MKILTSLILFIVVYVFSQNVEYRFDYEWSEQAGGWLKYHVIPATWDEARLRCHAEGAVLASPITSELKEAIVQFIRQQARGGVEPSIFTGVHAFFSKGDYSSIEGVPLLRLSFSWATGEPDNYENSESCLAMLSGQNGALADTRCDDVLPYVCYKKFAQLTFNSCGTVDPGYILEPRTGSCYKFHNTGLVWSQAYMTCVAEGGHLVVIDNDEEADVIKQIIAKHPANAFKAYNHDLTNVGYHDWGHFGTSFMTIHGESLDEKYGDWENGEPSNSSYSRVGDFGESCGSVRRDGRLNDNYCHTPTTFICEMKPNSLKK